MKLLALNDIPSPYRLHFYQALADAVQHQHGIFSLRFMSWSEPRRNWVYAPHDLPPYADVLSGLHLTRGSTTMHFNPAIITEILRFAPDWILLSGGWFHPTNQILRWLKPLLRSRIIFWSESNLRYVQHHQGFVQAWRTASLRGWDAFVVPGQMAADYVRQVAGHAKPLLTMPNIVDETRFRDQVQMRRLHRSDLLQKWNLHHQPHPILLTVARLDPIKGVDRLLDALVTDASGQQVTLLVAGEGSQRADLHARIVQAGAADRFRLLGYRQESELLDLLALADAFILPSIGDPYPLSVIEAAFAGLPLLLSDRVGCHPEILQSMRNGFLFDPFNMTSIQQAIAQFVSADPAMRAQMGQQSLQIANRHFATETVVNQFLQDLQALS